MTLKIDENGILIWPDDNFNDSVKKSFTPWNQVKKITFGARQKGGDIYYSLRIIKRSKKFVFFYLNDYVYFYTYRLKKAIMYFSGRKDIC